MMSEPAFSRRRAILGDAALAAVPVAAQAAVAGSIDDADARLVQLAEVLRPHETQEPEIASMSDETLDLFLDRYGAIEEGMVATPADSLTGCWKARLCHLNVFRDCVCANVPLRIADDLVRLHAEGAVHV